jgi:hypothetical protein
MKAFLSQLETFSMSNCGHSAGIIMPKPWPLILYIVISVIRNRFSMIVSHIHGFQVVQKPERVVALMLQQYLLSYAGWKRPPSPLCCSRSILLPFSGGLLYPRYGWFRGRWGSPCVYVSIKPFVRPTKEFVSGCSWMLYDDTAFSAPLLASNSPRNQGIQ